MRRITPMLALMMMACGYQQDEFSVDYTAAVCQLYEDCEVLTTLAGYETRGECNGAVIATVDEARGRCPDYDKKIALDCVNGINQMKCQAIYDDAWPQACSQVCPDGAAQQSPLDTGVAE